MEFGYWLMCLVGFYSLVLKYSTDAFSVNGSRSFVDDQQVKNKTKRSGDASAMFSSAIRRNVFSDAIVTPEGRNYYFSKVTIRDRWAAAALCKMFGGALVPLDSKDKFYELHRLILQNKQGDLNFNGFWAGATDIEAEGMYKTDYKDRMLGFAEFGCNGAPNGGRWENCLAFLEECAWYLNDIKCTDSDLALGFICENMQDISMSSSRLNIRQSLFYQPFVVGRKHFYISRMGISDNMAAVYMCKMIGCDVAQVDSVEELKAMRAVLKGNNVFFKRVFISGTDRHYEGKWLHHGRDGKELPFLSWDGTNPNGWRAANCLAIVDEYNMGDESCSRHDLADGDSFACSCKV